MTTAEHYPVTPRAGAEHQICGYDSEMWPCKASLIAQVEQLERERDALQVELEKVTKLVWEAEFVDPEFRKRADTYLAKKGA